MNKLEEYNAEINKLVKQKNMVEYNREKISKVILKKMDEIENLNPTCEFHTQQNLWDFCEDQLNELKMHTNKMIQDFEDEIVHYKKRIEGLENG